MLKISNKFFLILIVSLFIILPVNSFAVHVTFFLGDVKLIRDGSAITIQSGDVLQGGDTIQTGASSEITLNYKDESSIVVKENSQIVIGTKDIKDSEDVALVSGNASGKFTKLVKDGASRKVYGPTIVCAIRGTEFSIAVSKNGDSRVDLNEGKLEVNNPYGSTNLKSNQKVEAGVGEEPEKSKMGDAVGDWQKKRDQDLEKNPEKAGKNYDKYLKTFNKRNKESNKELSEADSTVKGAKNKDDISKAGKEIDSSEQKIKDDLMMNRAANLSIEGVLNDYKDRKGQIFDIFEKVKKESNKVLEQQQRNYEAIQKVKQAHREAYDKIMGKYQDDKNKILKGFKSEDVRPKFKDK